MHIHERCNVCRRAMTFNQAGLRTSPRPSFRIKTYKQVHDTCGRPFGRWISTCSSSLTCHVPACIHMWGHMRGVLAIMYPGLWGSWGDNVETTRFTT